MEFTDDVPEAGTSRYAAEASEARDEPGRWGLLSVVTPRSEADVKRAGTRARLLAHSVRTGRLVAFRPAGSFEATTRTVALWSGIETSVEYMVYVRWVGDSGYGT